MDRNKEALENLRKKHKKSVMIYGASCHKSTGNSKLIYHIAKGLQSKGHTVWTIGFDYNFPQQNFDGIPVLPSFHCQYCGNSHKGETEQVIKIAQYLKLFNPDIFLCVGDPIMMQQFGIGNIQFETMQNTKAVMYSTLDSEGILCNDNLKAMGRRDYIEFCDKVISTAKFTQEQFKQWLDLDTELIYETIDMGNFNR